MFKLSIFDHAFTGPMLTWSNRHLDGFIARKLDRVLVNDNWCPLFTHSSVELLPLEVSDHCPAFIQVQQGGDSHPKPFRFFNFWTKHSAFLDLVEESWNSHTLEIL